MTDRVRPPWFESEGLMKALARRLSGVFALALCTTIGIAMTWSQALGQSTPDAAVLIPEPSSLLAMATGIGVVAYLRARRRK
jgi:hypothetical protein